MKITDTMSSSQKKTVWSLQDNKRTPTQREAFKPTGKTPKKHTGLYVLSVVGVMFLVSFLLTQISESKLETCLTSSYCINSIDNVFLYTLYVFANLIIILLAAFGAYIIGKKLGNMIKR